MTQHYIGVKKILAWPEEKDGKQGYGVTYEDGYTSWSPKETFERAYLPIGEDGSKITQEVVDTFLGDVESQRIDEKTTLVKARALTDFRQYEVSSCVNPANYDHEIGTKIATERIKNTLWKCLGFVLQWAENGLKREGKPSTSTNCFRKKSIVVQAVQWKGTLESVSEMEEFLGDGPQADFTQEGTPMFIETHSGQARVDIGDWVIKETKPIKNLYPNGDFYPCTGKVFSETYELV